MKNLRKTLAVAVALATVSGGASAAGLKFDRADNRFSWDSLVKFEQMDFAGEEVRFDGPWAGQGEMSSIDTVLAYFNQATGANVVYNGSNDMEQLVLVDMKAGNPPNIAAWAQPGTASELAETGNLVPLKANVEAAVRDSYAASESFLSLGTFADPNGNTAMFGLPYNMNLKSLVWYIPENFEEMGYEVPQTMEELIALSDQIVADGGTPWCIGMESGGATGWVGTDWMEDLMLRSYPLEVYNDWISNEMPFNDPKVIEVMNTFGQFVLNDDYVSGSSASVASIAFGDSVLGLFETPPKCYLHRQASFIPTFFPEGGDDEADFFYFPSYASKDLGNPILGGGTLITVMKSSPATEAFLEFLTTPLAHELWMADGGFLTPHQGANPDAYATDALRKQGEIFLNATTFGFDASDMMPGAIGSGAFWTGMVDFTSGKSAEEVANDIQNAWDAIK